MKLSIYLTVVSVVALVNAAVVVPTSAAVKAESMDMPDGFYIHDPETGETEHTPFNATGISPLAELPSDKSSSEMPIRTGCLRVRTSVQEIIQAKDGLIQQFMVNGKPELNIKRKQWRWVRIDPYSRYTPIPESHG